MPMKRADLLTQIRIAGYHDDHKAGTRLYCENRISRVVYDEAFRAGQQAKANGVKCGCLACRKATTEG